MPANKDLEDTLEDLKRYKKLAPDFVKAIEACAKAEAELKPEDDPAEGKIVKAPVIKP